MRMVFVCYAYRKMSFQRFSEICSDFIYIAQRLYSSILSASVKKHCMFLGGAITHDLNDNDEIDEQRRKLCNRVMSYFTSSGSALLQLRKHCYGCIVQMFAIIRTGRCIHTNFSTKLK